MCSLRNVLESEDPPVSMLELGCWTSLMVPRFCMHRSACIISSGKVNIRNNNSFAIYKWKYATLHFWQWAGILSFNHLTSLHRNMECDDVTLANDKRFLLCGKKWWNRKQTRSLKVAGVSLPQFGIKTLSRYKVRKRGRSPPDVLGKTQVGSALSPFRWSRPDFVCVFPYQGLMLEAVHRLLSSIKGRAEMGVQREILVDSFIL